MKPQMLQARIVSLGKAIGWVILLLLAMLPVLVSLGYLIYDSNLGRYSIGPSTVSLGYSALSSSPVVTMVQPILQMLAEKSGVAAALGARAL